jgi:hypothetical protein
MRLMKGNGETIYRENWGSNVSGHGVGDKDECRRRAGNQYVVNSATRSEKKAVKLG